MKIKAGKIEIINAKSGKKYYKTKAVGSLFEEPVIVELFTEHPIITGKEYEVVIDSYSRKESKCGCSLESA